MRSGADGELKLRFYFGRSSWPSMTRKQQYKNDVTFLLSKQHTNGGELWACADGSIGKGSPFSTRDVASMLRELGYTRQDSIVKNIAELLFQHQQPDGRFKSSSSGAIYPCHTIGTTRVLCWLGYSKDKRLRKTFDYLLSIQEEDGGWKCNKFSFGRGPETIHSNPGTTLEALDALRFRDEEIIRQAANRAVAFLLWHGEYKLPVGPCHFGIGSLFKQTEFPFFRYNLFYYTYVLSFFPEATHDKRFKQYFKLLSSKLQDGKLIIENPNRHLAHLQFCMKSQPSELATRRFREIEKNVRESG